MGGNGVGGPLLHSGRTDCGRRGSLNLNDKVEDLVGLKEGSRGIVLAKMCRKKVSEELQNVPHSPHEYCRQMFLAANTATVNAVLSIILCLLSILLMFDPLMLGL